MNFSNAIKHSGEARYSPNGNYLAIAKGMSLIVYDTTSFEIKQRYSFSCSIAQVEWAPDSCLIAIALVKIGQCHIKAVDLNEWKCVIDEGTAGVSYVKWATDSRRLLVVDEFNSKITIYSVNDNSLYAISNPKVDNNKQLILSFSSNGYFMALIERKDWHDSVGIYFVGNWSLVSHFSIETNDAQGILWNKDCTALIIWDTPIESRFYVYSPTGGLIISHDLNTSTLGVVTLKTSPNGHILSVGCSDGTVYLYNQMTWKVVSKLTHSLEEMNKEGHNVFKEDEGMGHEGVSKYVECSLPVTLPKNKSKEKQSMGDSAKGVSIVDYSFDSNYMTTLDDAFPHIAWIWQISTLALHTVIIQSKPIKHFKWSPNSHHLLIGTDNPKLYLFTLTDMSIVDLLADKTKSFSINKIEWNPDGNSFILCDKCHLIIGTPESDKDA